MIPSVPCAGWLVKKKTRSFSHHRWQPRFFVLLDSELRYYKSEHAATPSRSQSLKDIGQIIPTSNRSRPFCFRLEFSHGKPWIIQCRCKRELDIWITAIYSRVSRHLPSLTTPSVSLLTRRGRTLPSVVTLHPPPSDPLPPVPTIRPSDLLRLSTPSLSTDGSFGMTETPKASRKHSNGSVAMASPTFLVYKERFKLTV